MDLSQIDEVLGSTRSKLPAADFVSEFLASGDLGREIDLNSPIFTGKDAKQVKTALDNARKKVNEDTGQLAIPGGNTVQVRVKQETNGKRGDEKVIVSEHVYIINTAKVAEARAAQNGNK